MKKTLLAILAATTLLRADPEPFAFVEISSFNQLQTDVSALATEIGQPALAMGLVGAGQFLGSPGLLGIDRERPIRIVFTAEHGALGNQPVLIVPLSDADGANYLQSLATLADQTGEQNGVRTFRFKQFPMVSHMRVVGGHAVFAMEGAVDDAYLTKVADELAADPKAYTISGLSGTIRAQLSTAAVIPLLDMRVREMLEGIEEDEQRTTVRKVTDQLLDLLRGASRVTLGLDYVESLGLSIWSRLDAKPDSPLQTMFQNFKVPSDRVLPYIGGSPVFLMADGTASELNRQLLPVLEALVPVLAQNEELADVQKQLAMTVENYRQSMGAVPGTTAGALRFDDKGRPVMVSVTEMEKPDVVMEQYVKSFSLVNGLANSGIRFADPVERTVDGVVVQSAAMQLEKPEDVPDNPVLDLLMKYAEENPFAYEFACRDGLILLTVGPVGALDAFLAPPAAEKAAPLEEMFPDMGNLGETVTRLTVDYATIAHGVLSFLNSGAPDDEKVPEEILEKLAEGPGRIGVVSLAKGDSAVGALRVSPGVFHIAAESFRIFGEYQRRAIEKAMQEAEENDKGGNIEDLKELSDEDLDKLLDAADPADGNP